MKYRIILILSLTFIINTSFAGTLIKGVIQNKKGNPLSGISICAKGTNTCTISNLNGAFEFYIPEFHNVLVVSGPEIDKTEISLENVDATNLMVTVNQKKDKSSLRFYIGSVASVPLGYGGEIGLLRQTGLIITYYFSQTHGFNLQESNILRNYRHLIGLGIPIRIHSYGNKFPSGIYTTLTGGVEYNNFHNNYVGISQIFTFGAGTFGLNFGWADLQEYDYLDGIRYNYNFFSEYKGIYVGLSIGFNF